MSCAAAYVCECPSTSMPSHIPSHRTIMQSSHGSLEAPSTNAAKLISCEARSHFRSSVSACAAVVSLNFMIEPFRLEGLGGASCSAHCWLLQLFVHLNSAAHIRLHWRFFQCEEIGGAFNAPRVGCTNKLLQLNLHTLKRIFYLF